MLSNLNKKPKYLVYQAGSIETTLEEESRCFLCVAEGNTREEVVRNWAENIELLYGHKAEVKYDEILDCYFDYFPIYVEPLLSGDGHLLGKGMAAIDKYRTREQN